MKKQKYYIFSLLLLSGIVLLFIFFKSGLYSKINKSLYQSHAGNTKKAYQSDKFINKALGYEISYPKGMQVDTSLAEIRTLIKNGDTQIEIYYDDLKDTSGKAESYINYSNNFIKNKKEHKLLVDENVKINGIKTHFLKWERRKLKHVSNDKNYYLSAEILKSKNEVYTVFIKSSKPIENGMQIIKSFNVFEKSGKLAPMKQFKKIKPSVNKETMDVYEKYFLDSKKLTWGIFENSAPKSMKILKDIEAAVDYDFRFLIKYHCFDSIFSLDEMKNAFDNNKIVELTLQTMSFKKDNSSITYDILDGKYDEYLNKYAQEIKAFGHPVMFRLNNEMNADWDVFSSYYSSKDTDLFKAMWIYIHNVFEKNNVDNVLWVWNPNHVSFPNYKWNDAVMYYPGSSYVDLVGLTAYNTGTYYSSEKWREFDNLYDSYYNKYSELYEQPLIIGEFACSSIGGNKIKWVNNMFDKIGNYPRIKVAIWWNGIDYDINKKPARIYRIDDPKELLDVFKERLKLFK
ncbi:MAG: glycoside hydrolase family 26 protein [Deltaproteobacteria bacterium]